MVLQDVRAVRVHQHGRLSHGGPPTVSPKPHESGDLEALVTGRVEDGWMRCDSLFHQGSETSHWYYIVFFTFQIKTVFHSRAWTWLSTCSQCALCLEPKVSTSTQADDAHDARLVACVAQGFTSIRVDDSHYARLKYGLNGQDLTRAQGLMMLMLRVLGREWHDAQDARLVACTEADDAHDARLFACAAKGFTGTGPDDAHDA